MVTQVAHDLLEKGHTLLAQAKVTGGQVWQNAKGELSKLNDAASSVFSNFLKTASSFWQEIVHSFGKMCFSMMLSYRKQELNKFFI